MEIKNEKLIKAKEMADTLLELLNESAIRINTENLSQEPNDMAREILRRKESNREDKRRSEMLKAGFKCEHVKKEPICENKLAIHCPTEELYVKVVTELLKEYRWRSGSKATLVTNWRENEEETCVSVGSDGRLEFCGKCWCTNKKCKTITAEDWLLRICKPKLVTKKTMPIEIKLNELSKEYGKCEKSLGGKHHIIQAEFGEAGIESDLGVLCRNKILADFCIKCKKWGRVHKQLQK